MLNIVKKILFATAISLLFSSVYAVDYSGCVKKTYVVSGYYSPIAWQTFYYKGNFAKETRLNGQWIQGASGRYVFNGMVAAPRNYKFGTKIYFPGLWVGQVEDRWNAIVNAGQRSYSHDRIDIWMWKWADGLKRALSFGKQTIVGYQCPIGKDIKTGFDYNNFPIIKDFFKQTFWGIGLYKGRNDERVKILQIYMKDLGYFDYETTGYFGSITEKAVCDFQVAYRITTRASENCGYLWPKTRWAIRATIVAKWLFSSIAIQKIDQQVILVQETIKTVTFSRGFTKWEKTETIKSLQEILKELGYYNGDITGIYDNKTIDAIYKFQIEKKIITSNQVSSAWYFWPQTRKALSQAIDEKAALDEEKRILAAKKAEFKEKIQNNEIFTRGYVKWEKADEIKILQEYLKKLDYYDGEITGIYDNKTIDAVYNLQLDNKIITSNQVSSAWYFVPQTRNALTNLIATLD